MIRVPVVSVKRRRPYGIPHPRGAQCLTPIAVFSLNGGAYLW